jgi:hypothetical protein
MSDGKLSERFVNWASLAGTSGEDSATLVAQKCIGAAITAYGLMEYRDLPCAVSSHGIGFTTWAMAHTPTYQELVTKAVEDIARAKKCGAEVIAWRRDPTLERDTEGTWKLKMRFHLLPKAANDAFWAGPVK